jgi:maltose O-acetyltransferase
LIPGIPLSSTVCPPVHCDHGSSLLLDEDVFINYNCDDCWLGGNVTIIPGVTVGNRCIVAAGSVVTKDIPDDCLVAGNPAVIKKKLNQ